MILIQLKNASINIPRPCSFQKGSKGKVYLGGGGRCVEKLRGVEGEETVIRI